MGSEVGTELEPLTDVVEELGCQGSPRPLPV